MGSIFIQMVISQPIFNIFNWFSTFGHYFWCSFGKWRKNWEILKIDFYDVTASVLYNDCFPPSFCSDPKLICEYSDTCTLTEMRIYNLVQEWTIKVKNFKGCAYITSFTIIRPLSDINRGGVFHDVKCSTHHISVATTQSSM